MRQESWALSKNHDKEYRSLAAHDRASRGSKEALRCHTCARIVTVSRWKTTFGGSQGGKTHKIGGVRSVEEN